MATHVSLCDGAVVVAALPFGDQSRGAGAWRFRRAPAEAVCMYSREHCPENKMNQMLHFHCVTPTQQ